MRKFPSNSGLALFQAQAYKNAGQLAQAKDAYVRLLAANPKLEHGYLQLAQIYGDMNQPDSSLAALRKAVQSGSDSASFVAQYALSVGNSKYKAANALKSGEPAENATKRAAMQADPDWQLYLQKSGEAGYLIKQENKLMNPAPFAPIAR